MCGFFGFAEQLREFGESQTAAVTHRGEINRKHRHTWKIGHIGGIAAGACAGDTAVSDPWIVVVSRIIFAVHFNESGSRAVAVFSEPCVIMSSRLVNPQQIGFRAVRPFGDLKRTAGERIDALQLPEQRRTVERTVDFCRHHERKQTVFPLEIHKNRLCCPCRFRGVFGKEYIILIMFQPDTGIAVADQQDRVRILFQFADISRKCGPDGIRSGEKKRFFLFGE